MHKNKIAILCFITGLLLGVILAYILIPKKQYIVVLPASEKTSIVEEVIEEVEEEIFQEHSQVRVFEEIPLSESLQYTLTEMCAKYGVSRALIVAVIEHESNFNGNLVSKTKDHGFMQINEVNFSWLLEAGIDPLTNEGNIEAGCKMLGQYLEKYGNIHKALIAYNYGEYGAKKLWSSGIETTQYSRTVYNSYLEWKKILSE